MGAQVAASKGVTTALGEAMKKGGKPAPVPPTAPTPPGSSKDAGEKFEAILNDQAAMKKAAETKPKASTEGGMNIVEAVVKKVEQDKAKAKEEKAVLKKAKSKASTDEYGDALKKAALEKLQAAAEKKAKYSSYSPFSKSDMPTAPKLQTPYPQYVFGSNVPGSDPYGDQLKQYQLQKLQQQQATEQDKIKNLFAMIAQSKQGQQPPVQG
jgi:hypothetical protein